MQASKLESDGVGQGDRVCDMRIESRLEWLVNGVVLEKKAGF